LDEIKLPKFRWGVTFERNSGHNQDEWGRKENNEEKSKIRFIVAYTVRGDFKIDTKGFL